MAKALAAAMAMQWRRWLFDSDDGYATAAMVMQQRLFAVRYHYHAPLPTT